MAESGSQNRARRGLVALMLLPPPLRHLPSRALLAVLLVCMLALQALAGAPARAADDSVIAAARCADAPDAPGPVDPQAGHCKLCGAAQTCFFIVFARAASVAAPAVRARLVQATPKPSVGLASAGWGSSWSSQAPPA